MCSKALFIDTADAAAAGIGYKSAGSHKLLYLMMLPMGNQVIDHSNQLDYHLHSCLNALAYITGDPAYEHVKTYCDIAMLVLRDWDLVGGNTYTYRLAADVYRMADFCGL